MRSRHLDWRKKKIIRIILGSVAIALVILLLMFNSGVAVLERVSGYIVIPIQKGATSVFGGVKNFFGGFSDNVKMKKKLSEAETNLAKTDYIQQKLNEALLENERLKALLNEKANYPELNFIYADVIAKSVTNYEATFTLNKGAKDGVKKDMPVIAKGGLAGRIIKVEENFSVLLAIIDSRSSVPGIVESSRDTGIVKGYVKAGQVQDNCTMTTMPIESKCRPGDIVKTSGMGDVFPKGIYIGEIIEVTAGSTKLDTTAQITPSVDFDHLEHVLIGYVPQE